jgi:ADP-heptose:LPS heptosyltransferase
MRIAFVQLASFGDLINSTLMFQPIKAKWPDCRLEVHTTTFYGSAYDHNPHIDDLIKHPCHSKDLAFSLYDTIPHQLHGYDKVMVPAPILRPDRRNSLRHPEYGPNLWCTFLRALEEEAIDYPWPPVSVLRLADVEVQRARAAAAMGTGKRCILMEVEGLSGQTYWNDHWTDRVGEHLLNKSETCLFISKQTPTTAIRRLQAPRGNGSQAVFVGHLSLREGAELHNHCQAFLSVSSGLCNACNTDWCRRDTLWVEAINSPTVSSVVFRPMHKHFWYENNLDGYLKLLRSLGL